MSTIEETIFSTLSADAGVGAICGDRIYPVVAPQDAANPYVIYTAISELPLNTLEGESPMKNRRFQFDCYAKTFAESRALYVAVHNALIGLSPRPVRQSLINFYESEPALFRFSVDYSIWQCEV